MNWLDLEVRRSKVTVPVRPNALFRLRHNEWRISVDDHLVEFVAVPCIQLFQFNIGIEMLIVHLCVALLDSVFFLSFLSFCLFTCLSYMFSVCFIYEWWWRWWWWWWWSCYSVWCSIFQKNVLPSTASWFTSGSTVHQVTSMRLW